MNDMMGKPKPQQQPKSNITPLPPQKLAEPPYSEEAEKAVIGALLVYPDKFHKVALFLKADDFYILRHKYIWECIAKLVERNEPVDLLTVSEELHRKGWLNDIGDAYLTDLVNSTPTALHAEMYGRIVEKTAVRRRLAKVADEIKAAAFDESKDTDAVLNSAEQTILDVASAARSSGMNPVAHVQDVAQDEWNRVDSIINGEVVMDQVISTGLRDLDNMLFGGFWPRKVHFEGARPTVGKSSTLYCFAAAAGKAGKKVAFFSAETDREDIVTQMIATEAGIQFANAKFGNMTPHEYSRYVDAVGKISKYKMFVDGSKTLTPHDIYRRVRDLKPDIVFIDYLNVLSWPTHDRENQAINRDDRTRLNAICSALPKIAGDLNVALVVAAQINRGPEQRQDHRPLMSDLKDTGKIEEIADLMMLLYRDAMYNDATEFPNTMEIIIPKNKLTGMVGSINVYFDRTLRKVMNAAARRVDLANLDHPYDDDRA